MSAKVLFLCIVAVCSGASISKRKNDIFPNEKIIGGVDADIAEFPHQIYMTHDGDFQCGGFIIGNDTVLSAGHCLDIDNPERLVIFSGSSNLEAGDKHDVVKTYRHPKYASNSDYDISLLVVKQQFQFSNTTQKIEISKEEPKDGLVTYTGWGVVNESDHDSPKHLQKVVVPVVPRDECNSDYSFMGGITDRMWCAGVKGKGPCYGDSGGAIVQNGKAVGIVSWGFGCAHEGFPAVNTNIANKEIRQFINDILSS